MSSPVSPLALTLVAAPEAAADLHVLAGDLALDLGAETLWLAQGRACDLLLESDSDPSDVEKRASLAVGSAKVDWALQPQEGRRKALLVADMESTIIEQEMVDELAGRIGLRAEIAEITRRSMAGELDFEASLRARVEKLGGTPALLLDEVAQAMTLIPGARQLVATMRAKGALTALVTGGFSYFAEMVQQAVGFDELFCNHLVVEGGVVTGALGEPVLDRGGKLETLKALSQRLGIELSQAAAVGDGANDIEMIQAAGLGVSFRGKEVLRSAARFRVDHTGLDSLLFYQGLREEDFAIEE